jgi:hypothetical protein
VFGALVKGGVPVVDERNGVTTPRLDVAGALLSLQRGLMAAQTVAPASLRAGTKATTITVNGPTFPKDAVVRWNGQERPTAFVSATELRVTLTDADLARPGVALLTVSSATLAATTTDAKFLVSSSRVVALALSAGQ